MITSPDSYFVKYISVAASAALKVKILLCRSIDCYDTDPGGQATYHDGHKIAFSL